MGLLIGKKYRVRAYATNLVGTSYGDTVQVELLPIVGGTDIRVRAYAINSTGISYGDTVQVTTKADTQTGFLLLMV